MSAILLILLISVLIFAIVLGRGLLPDVVRLLRSYGVQLLRDHEGSPCYYGELGVTLVATLAIAAGTLIFKGAFAAVVAWLSTSDTSSFAICLRGTFTMTTELQHPSNFLLLLFVGPLLKLVAMVVLVNAFVRFFSALNEHRQNQYDSSDVFFFSFLSVLFIICIEVLWHIQNVHLLNLTTNVSYIILNELAYLIFFMTVFFCKMSRSSGRKLHNAFDRYLEMNAIEQKLIHKPVMMILLAYAIAVVLSLPNFLGLQWLDKDFEVVIAFVMVMAVVLLLLNRYFAQAWNLMATLIFDMTYVDDAVMEIRRVDLPQRGKKAVLIFAVILLAVFAVFYFKLLCVFLALLLLAAVMFVTASLVVYFCAVAIASIFLRERVDYVSSFFKAVFMSIPNSMRIMLVVSFASFALLTVFPKNLPEIAMNCSVVDAYGDVLFVDDSGDYYVPMVAGEIPDFLKKVLMCQEDRFFDKQRSLLPNRSNWHGLSFGFLKGRGGSNINSQLVKNYTYLTRGIYPKDVSRKACDMVGAYMVSLTQTPEEIMTQYLNVASFHGGRGFRGINAASLYAFGKPVCRLNELQQLYMVMTLPRGSYLYDPAVGRFPYTTVRENEEDVKKILLNKAEKLYATGFLSRKEYNRMTRQSLAFINENYKSGISVGTRQLLTRANGNGRASTYINLANEQAIGRAFEVLKHNAIYSKNSSELQTAAVVVEVKTGHVIGHYSSGLLDYTNYLNGFPIGSLGKPAIVLEMLALGASPNLTLYDGQVGNRKTPKNANHGWSNTNVDFSEILSRSLNAPFANIRDIMNARAVFLNTEHSYGLMGIEEERALCDDIYNYPLGNRLMTVMEVSAVYQTIMNDGVHIPLAVMNADSVSLPQRIYPSNNIRVVKSALAKTLQSGTMFSYRDRLPKYKTFYAKTGTSSGQKDGWCVLSDGDVLIVSWCSYGHQNGNTMTLGTEPLYGSSTAGLFSVLIYNELKKDNR